MSPRSPSTLQASSPSYDYTPSGSASVPQRAFLVPATAHKQAPPQYISDSRHGWGSARVLASIPSAITALPLAFIGPVTQIFNVVSEATEAVKTMREGKDGFERLLRRILKFLQSLVDELQTINEPIPPDAPTAARLDALEWCVFPTRRASSVLRYFSLCGSNLKAIRDDAIRWSRLSLLNTYLKRDEIKVALSKHGEDLTDCLSMFQVRAYSIHSFT